MSVELELESESVLEIDLKQVVVVDVSGILELFDVRRAIIPGFFML